ncbi:MAG TPA: MBL fold metallo-hydrolase [Polyangiaceae bacterium]
MEIEFVGGARTVTGSKHVVRTDKATVLLDCGLFQGRRQESNERNHHLGVDPKELSAVVLSHAHIDHSGALPLLVKQGYGGAIHSTAATRDLCAAMLIDAALIQAADARYVNKRIQRDGADMTLVEPLYTEADALRALEQFETLGYHRKRRIAPGVELTFLDAGHVLGSAVVVLDMDDEGERKRLVFTGDLGRKGTPILRDPEVPDGAHVLVSESTYGDRLHGNVDEMDDALGAALHKAHARGGKVIIPSFALERAQEIVFALKRLTQKGKLPRMPVYVDSPLTVKITEVFKLHPECFDEHARALLSHRDSPFVFEDLSYVEDKRDSQELDRSPGPAVIISASGMCEGGRVVHHLQAGVEDPRNMVIIVGFQAQHTLGRRLVERRERVRIFGVERDLRAEVVVLNGFSAHADQAGLIQFAEDVRARGPLRDVLLVHGEPKAQDVLRKELQRLHFPSVRCPAPREKLRF